MALEHRQQAGGSSTSAASATNAASSASASAATTAAASGTASGTATGATTSAPPIGITGGPGYNSSAPHSTVAANGNPGQIIFTQPPLQSTSFYKIYQGVTVTFGWNFTDVLVQPSAITVSAVCANGNTYPVGPSNGVIAGDAQSVEWDLYAYQTANPSLPLAQESYTLQVFAQGGPSAIPTPGYLEPNQQLQFALYTPEAYTPLASGWTCAGCGGALEQLKAHPASIALITTLLVIFLSGFTTLRRVWD